MTGAVFHEPGMYLGMPEHEYHNDGSFSTSGIHNLRVSPLTYWINSPHNPDRDEMEPDETVAKSKGNAFHKRILEGEEAFRATYTQKLNPADHPNALKSGEQLRAYCKQIGLKQSGTLSEMSERIREVDAVVELWSEIEAEYLKAHEGKDFLSKQLIGQIDLAASAIEANPNTAALFSGGFPEVSIFWVDQATGVRMKARLDYLNHQFIPDLKSFSNPNRKRLDQAVTSAIAGYGYGIQAVAYLDAVTQAKRLLKEAGMGAVHLGESMLNAAIDLEAWFAKFKASQEHRFVFVFQETGRVPNVALREFQRNMNYHDIVLFQYEAALRHHQDCVDRWGYGQPWVEKAEVQKLEDEDFPLWAFKEAV